MVVTATARLHEGSLIIDVQVNEDVGMTPGELAAEMEALAEVLTLGTPRQTVALHPESRAVYCNVVFPSGKVKKAAPSAESSESTPAKPKRARKKKEK